MLTSLKFRRHGRYHRESRSIRLGELWACALCRAPLCGTVRGGTQEVANLTSPSQVYWYTSKLPSSLSPNGDTIPYFPLPHQKTAVERQTFNGILISIGIASERAWWTSMEAESKAQLTKVSVSH